MIERKTASEIAKMREAGRVVAEVLSCLSAAIIPGKTTLLDLDQRAGEIAVQRDAVPALLGYRGFPARTCLSVNEVVVHGVPDERVLENGDIVTIDFACAVDGYHADGAITVPVGQVSFEAARLLRVGQECLSRAIDRVQPGVYLGDLAAEIHSHAETAGYFIAQSLVGHGVGRSLHEAPQVPNYGPPQKGVRLEPGLTLAIEPMVNAGTPEVENLSDGWSVVTADRGLSAHFEHTIVVTETGAEILTAPPVH